MVGALGVSRTFTSKFDAYQVFRIEKSTEVEVDVKYL
jgi:hypothetical protein